MTYYCPKCGSNKLGLLYKMDVCEFMSTPKGLRDKDVFVYDCYDCGCDGPGDELTTLNPIYQTSIQTTTRKYKRYRMKLASILLIVAIYSLMIQVCLQ